MLLDEADLFLAQRTVTDIPRNALVSGMYVFPNSFHPLTTNDTVFLRVLLEYYEGILFLTTKPESAHSTKLSKSRIHIYRCTIHRSIGLTNRSEYGRIISNRLHLAIRESKGDHDTLIAHAEHLFHLQASQKEFGPVWNGRHIRNAFQSAVALAGFRRPPWPTRRMEQGTLRESF